MCSASADHEGQLTVHMPLDMRSKLSDLGLLFDFIQFSGPILIELRRPHAWTKEDKHRGQTAMAKQGQHVDIFRLNTMHKTLCDADVKLRAGINL